MVEHHLQALRLDHREQLRLGWLRSIWRKQWELGLMGFRSLVHMDFVVAYVRCQRVVFLYLCAPERPLQQ